jgi:hypothetical protein
MKIEKGKRIIDLFDPDTLHGFLILASIGITVVFLLIWFLCKLDEDTSVYDKKSKLNTYQIILEKNNGIIDTLFMKSPGEMSIKTSIAGPVIIREEGENMLGVSINNHYSFDNIKKCSIKKIK